MRSALGWNAFDAQFLLLSSCFDVVALIDPWLSLDFIGRDCRLRKASVDLTTNRQTIGRNSVQVCDEAVTASGDGLDKNWLARVIAESLSQLLNVDS